MLAAEYDDVTKLSAQLSNGWLIVTITVTSRAWFRSSVSCL